MLRTTLLLTLLLLAPSSAHADGSNSGTLDSGTLDWEVQEDPAGPGLTWLRGARDGVLGLFDTVTDLQLSLFSETSLLLGTVVMAASDTVGVVDDNPVTQYVFKAVASKSLAKTAYLLNLAGSEAILGSHGLEKEWYIEAALTELNPLLGGDPVGPAILLDPLDFFDDRMVHTAVYRSRIPGTVALASLGADGLLRPLSCLARIAGLHKPADALQASATALMRRAID
ncbi:MAG: hypothetical protein GY725_17725 [bacterium]|nr:hypothetical protein [bacterium]